MIHHIHNELIENTFWIEYRRHIRSLTMNLIWMSTWNLIFGSIAGTVFSGNSAINIIQRGMK